MKKIITLAIIIIVLGLLGVYKCSGMSDAKLQGAIKIANKSSMPMELAEGLTLSEAVAEKDYVMFICETDEEQYNIDVMRNSIKDYSFEEKKTIFSLMASDPAFKKFSELITDADKGIGIRYRGIRTGNVTEITLSADDFRQILNEI